MIKIFFALAFICINIEQKKEDLMQKKKTCFVVHHFTLTRQWNSLFQMLVSTVLVAIATERVPGKSLPRRSPLSLRWSVCWKLPGSAGSVTWPRKESMNTLWL